MALDNNNHPCFNAEARHSYGRIHLAVAPRCNVQCNFCDRKFDCANESRPGVTTSVLTPQQALAHLDDINKKLDNLAVVGIAGPGDPFANPNETMETLERVYASYPDKLLCVSTNGLSLADYIPRLARLSVSHVTVTVNAVRPEIGADIYEWVHYGGKTYFGTEGAQLLLERQTEAIKLLKQYGLTVKINTVVIPRVNEYHIPEVARYVSALGADIQNCIPLIPVKGTPFAGLQEPSVANMQSLRAETSLYVKQMEHCGRCRADAVGLIGRSNPFSRKEEEKKPVRLVAVATSDGVSVDRHLGMAYNLWIYSWEDGKVKSVERRSIIACQRSSDRWNEIAAVISDCDLLLVNKVGQPPLQALKNKGIRTEAVSGSVQEILTALFTGEDIPAQNLRLAGHCDGSVNQSATCHSCASEAE
ncbi:molybdenum cofactor biosynthesis protein A [Bacteroidales bacterium Barb6XT]|nr:molybdenum cofactor biosynthesis protein A [Bacteroidales bacterium Barb6XT]